MIKDQDPEHHAEVSLESFVTPLGTMALNPKTDAKMVRSFRQGIYPNASLIRFARSVTTSSSTVVDIGAHIGTFTVPMAGSVKSVIAFEPAPDTIPLLRDNCKNNGVQVDIRTVGLGRVPGSASVETRKEENAGANTLVRGGDIRICTLDSEVPAADFIKIDVEGMEMEVLEGGTELIARSHPIVFFEVNLSQLRAHGTSPKALETFFKEKNYLLYYLLEKDSEQGSLSRVDDLSLLTACIAPRAWLFRGESAPFDIIAIPAGTDVPYTIVGFGAALMRALKHNLAIKVQRIKKAFHV